MFQILLLYAWYLRWLANRLHSWHKSSLATFAWNFFNLRGQSLFLCNGLSLLLLINIHLRLRLWLLILLLLWLRRELFDIWRWLRFRFRRIDFFQKLVKQLNIRFLSLDINMTKIAWSVFMRVQMLNIIFLTKNSYPRAHLTRYQLFFSNANVHRILITGLESHGVCHAWQLLTNLKLIQELICWYVSLQKDVFVLFFHLLRPHNQNVFLRLLIELFNKKSVTSQIF